LCDEVESESIRGYQKARGTSKATKKRNYTTGRFRRIEVLMIRKEQPCRADKKGSREFDILELRVTYLPLSPLSRYVINNHSMVDKKVLLPEPISSPWPP
jgi:hypothetical protein